MLKPTTDMVRLVPFGFIGDFIRESSFELIDPSTYLKVLTEPCFYTVVLNIIMFIPFGMYLRYYFKCGFTKTIYKSFLLSLFFELTQLSRLYFIYPYQYRVFDIDDLIMNTLGGILGYYIMGLIARFLPTRDKIDSDSLNRGRIVSGFRRITLFWLDFFLYIVTIILTSICYKDYYITYIAFIIYFMVIPYILKGQTIGGKFLKVKLEYPNYIFIRNSLYFSFIYIYYFTFPYILISIVSFIRCYLNFNATESIWLYFMLLIIILGFYLRNIFILLKKKTIFYDNLFRVKYKSTVEVRDN